MERQTFLTHLYVKALELRTGRSNKRGELPKSNTSRGLETYSKYITDISAGSFSLTRMLDSMKSQNKVWLDIGCGDAGAIYEAFTRTRPYANCCECVGITAKRTGFYFEHPEH